MKEPDWLTADVPDNPLRTAGPGELESDAPFDDFEREATDEELEAAFQPLLNWAEMQLRAERQEEAEGAWKP